MAFGDASWTFPRGLGTIPGMGLRVDKIRIRLRADTYHAIRWINGTCGRCDRTGCKIISTWNGPELKVSFGKYREVYDLCSDCSPVRCMMEDC